MISFVKHSLVFLVTLPLSILGAERFSFGGFTWDQAHTPIVLNYLGEGKNFGGAKFSDGFPQEVTRSVPFPDKEKNFDPSLTLGFLEDEGSSGARALNLPLFNDGSLMRHGVTLGWGNNQMVPNLNGPEFVIYESGEGSNGEPDSLGPELFMIRARHAITHRWTDWYHKSSRIFAPYGKVTSAGAYVVSFDLDELGLVAGDAVDRLELANMVRSDSITGPSIPFAGNVLFTNPEGRGVTPRPAVPFIGSYEQNLLYGPDLLYVACLQKPMPNPIHRVEQATQVSMPQKKLSSRDARAEEIVVLLALEGLVAVFQNHNGQFLPDGKVFQNMSVGPGYSIVTGDRSAATILLPDGAVLVMQPGSLISLDNVVQSNIEQDPTQQAATRFTIHLIRGAFLLANKNTQGGDASFELDSGRTGINGTGGVIFFQMGEPLRGEPDESAGKARQIYFELKTGMLSIPDGSLSGAPVPYANPIQPRPVFAPPNINPSNLPNNFAPLNLAFQNLAFLQNAIIPEGTFFATAEDALGYFDPNKFFNLLIPGNGEDGLGGSSANIFADLVSDDGTLSIDGSVIQSIENDPSMINLLELVGESNLRLVLDSSGNPVFLSDDGSSIDAFNAPDIIKQLLADNPDLNSLLDLATDGVLLNLGDEGLSFQLENSNAIPGINPNIQLTLDEDGNIVFNPDQWPDGLPEGIGGEGDISLDQMVIKRPEGNEGRLRRAHAQRISQIQTLKTKKTVTTANQQRAVQSARAAQQRAARDAQRRAQQASQRAAQRRR